MERTKYNQL